MIYFKKIVFCLLAAAVAVLSCITVHADSREYFITAYNINVNILPDGSADVEEQITYKFKGQFNGVFLDVDFTGSKGLIDHSLIVKKFEGTVKLTNNSTGNEGTYKYSAEGNTSKFTVYEPSKDISKTFIYKYKLLDVVTRYNDIAEFNRKLVGKNWQVPVHNIKISINLPEGASKDEIKIFSHGPLTGESRFINDTLSEYTVPAVNSGSFFETRVLFPTRLVPSSQNVVSSNAYDRIMEQEAQLAEEANQARAKAREEIERKKVLEIIGKVLTVVLLAVWIVVMIQIRKNYGTDPDTPFNGKYYREIPGDYTPAEMAILMNFSGTTAKEMLATLLDLVRKRILLLNVENKSVRKFIMKKHITDYVFTKNLYAPEIELKSHETNLIYWLFTNIAEGERFSLADFKEYAKKEMNRRSFGKSFYTWKSHVKKEAAQNKFFAGNSVKASLFGLFTGLGFIAAGVAAGMYLYNWAAIISFLGIVTFLFAAAQSKHTEYGSDQYKKWHSFKRFIKDFSNIKDATIPSVAIWEQYLVYAIPLGVAKEVIRHMPIELLQENAQALDRSPIVHCFAGSGQGYTDINSLSSTFSDMNASFNSAVSIANSTNSSSSGSGGGSSGGSSGGGGGGSGGGAF